MRKSLGAALGGAAVICAVLTPAAANAATTTLGRANAPLATGPSVDTIVTFTVTSGALTITAPDTANLGSGAPGTTISRTIGPVTVTDDRALLTATWTATVSSTDLVTGGGTGSETIPAPDATYTVGPIATTGTITATGTGVTLSNEPQPVVAGTAGVGDNTATWNPTVAVAVPASAVAGLYTGTITHSVS